VRFGIKCHHACLDIHSIHAPIKLNSNQVVVFVVEYRHEGAKNVAS